MSKVYLTFDLDKPEDRLSFNQMMFAGQAIHALWEIQMNLPRIFKHRDLSEQETAIYSEMIEAIYRIIEKEELNLEALSN